MSKEDEKNAAFPGAPYASYQTGMSLRDYFAAAALTGLCAHPESALQASVICGKASLSKAAWTMADAMLAARKEGA